MVPESELVSGADRWGHLHASQPGDFQLDDELRQQLVCLPARACPVHCPCVALPHCPCLPAATGRVTSFSPGLATPAATGAATDYQPREGTPRGPTPEGQPARCVPLAKSHEWRLREETPCDDRLLRVLVIHVGCAACYVVLVMVCLSFVLVVSCLSCCACLVVLVLLCLSCCACLAAVFVVCACLRMSRLGVLSSRVLCLACRVSCMCMYVDFTAACVAHPHAIERDRRTLLPAIGTNYVNEHY